MKGLPDLLISSHQNPRVKHLRKLKERRHREKEEQYLIEGYRELSRALACHAKIEELYYCPTRFLGKNEEALIESIKRKAKVFELTEKIFDKVSYRDRPDGLLAVAKKEPQGVEALEKFLRQNPNPFLLVAESIEKPGNLGSIIRSADGAGLDALVICDQCTDIYNPNVVRSSVGTLFSLPIFEVTSEEALFLLKKHHVHIVATTPSAPLLYTQADFRQSLAIVVGTEQVGLTEKWLRAATISVKIPMLGIADSLNVSNATSLLLYEVVRQKNV